MTRCLLFALAGFSAACLAHILQLVCWHGSAYAWWLDYVAGGPGTNVAFRVQPHMALADRWQAALDQSATYYVAAFDVKWTTPWFWLALAGCAAVIRPTWRGVLGAALIVVSFPWGYALFAPNTLGANAHLCVRLVPVTLCLAVACLAVRARA